MSDASDTPSDADAGRPLDGTALWPLLDAVLEAPPESREAVLERVSAGDAVRRAALAALVAECERATPFLDRPAAERFAALATDVTHTHIPTPALPDLLGGRYRPLRELGRGGMAIVYLARDVRHDRDVAVKMIRGEVGASFGNERFQREIEIAARLRHPNIVPLYDSGDNDGFLYFVMPYEEGPTLRARIGEGQIPLHDVVRFLREIARALQYAHERHVVHPTSSPRTSSSPGARPSSPTSGSPKH
ncbi:MAG: serine/threonine-protein kinase [Gemmatimonadaceae bacterium]